MATEFNTQVGNGEYRLQFETNNEAHYLLMQSAARRCIDHAHMTNADCIRNMTDEELAEFLTHINPTNCQDCAFSHGWRCSQTETTVPILRNAKRVERVGSSSRWRRTNDGKAD